MKAPTTKAQQRPTAQDLAPIAAQILPLHDGNAEAAAGAALALWEQCAKAIETAKREREDAEQLARLQHDLTEAMAPALTFPELLRRLMPDLRNDEREKRFRDYLAEVSRAPGEQPAGAGAGVVRGGELLAQYREITFAGLHLNGIENAFNEWWANRLSMARAEAARK